MFELTIGGKVCPLSFGMGFVREIDKTMTAPIEGTKTTREIGLNYKVAGILDGDVGDLIDVLDIANKHTDIRFTRAAFEAHVEDEETDIDKLFETVLGFLEKANCTRKKTLNLMAEVEKRKQEN